MSDGTQGEGWWQASDGQWYPPDQHPGGPAPSPPPDATAPMAAPFGPPPSSPPPTGAPMGSPTGPPAGAPPAGAPTGPPPGAPGANNNAKWIIGAAVVTVIAVVAAFLLLGGDSKKSNIAATNSSSSSSSSSKSTTTTKPKTTTTSSSSLTPQDLQARMLTGREIAADFVDSTFALDTGPTNCGETNLNQQVPTVVDVGSTSSNGSASFQEETKIYSSSAEADKVVDIFKAQTTCTGPTITGGEPVQFTSPKDVSSSVSTTVQVALEVDFQTPEAQGQFFVIKDGPAVVTFTFAARQGFDISQLPPAIDIVNKGIDKIIQ